jgi:hypothetical protein
VERLPLGRVPDAPLWSHTHPHEPKTGVYVKAQVASPGRGRAIRNVSMIMNTFLVQKNVSDACAAKASMQLLYAESIAKWYI